ncbi:MAG TPA: hypothetical protein VNX25_01475 [Verrucomicrobiae bacterium]|nr:hypothetical protein [Verrucomicrobiae bacterium]
MRKTVVPLVLAAALALGAEGADAGLTAGPARADAFPMWLQDPNGLKLQLCLESRNPKNPEAGPCLFAMRGKNILEAAYWSAEGFIEHPDFDRILLVMALEAEVVAPEPVDPEAPPTAAPAGPTVFNMMRFRMDPVKEKPLPEGIYTVETPFGSFTVAVTAGVARQNPERVDVLVGRVNGQLAVGEENFLSFPLAAGTPPVLDGPISVFPRAAVAPPGFVGDAAEIPEPGAPPAPPAVNPGPPPTGEQPLVGAPGGSTFRITYPDGTTVVGGAPGQALFTVQGSIFETPGAAASVTASFSKPNRRTGTLTIATPTGGTANAAAFGPQLPPPAADTNGDQITELAVPSGTSATVTFTGARPAIPRRVVLTPAGGGDPVVTQVTDAITGTATFTVNRRTGLGTLRIVANSGFDTLPAPQRPQLTTMVNDQPVALNRAGSVIIRNLPANPGSVTINSTAGGTAVIPVSMR